MFGKFKRASNVTELTREIVRDQHYSSLMSQVGEGAFRPPTMSTGIDSKTNIERNIPTRKVNTTDSLKPTTSQVQRRSLVTRASHDTSDKEPTRAGSSLQLLKAR